MLQADIGNNRHLGGIDNICGIKQAAQTNFQNDDVAVFLCKIFHSDGRDQFKLSRVILHRIGQFLHFGRDPAQGFLRDILPADLDPLAEVLYIRRRIQAGDISRLPQDPLQHRACTPLAVAACHMDKPQLLLGIPKQLKKIPCSGKSQLPLAPGVSVNIINRLLYRHFHILRKMFLQEKDIPAADIFSQFLIRRAGCF